MKKLLIATSLIFLFSIGTAFAVLKYQCYSYKNGKPDKMVHVTADNKEQAVQLACEKFKKLGIKYESVQCK